METNTKAKKVTKKARSAEEREGMGIALTKGDKVLQVICYAVTILWVALALIPMYWLILSSTKDQLDIYKRPVQLYPVIPNNYEFVLDYDSYDEKTIYQDSMIVLWNTMDQNQDCRAGLISAHIRVNGEDVAYAKLTKYNFVSKRNYIWSSNLLDGEQVISHISKIQEYEKASQGFTLMFWDKVKPVNEADLAKTNETTQMMMNNLLDEGLLQGKLSAAYVTKSFVSLFNNYIAAWLWPMSFVGAWGLGRAFVNSVFVAVMGILAQWIIIGLAAYSMAKLMPKKLAGYLTVFYLATMMIPSIVTLIPLYLTVERMGLTNTLWGVLLPSIPSAFNLVLFRGFFNNIPQSMFDAARIDGASELRIFTSMVIPLSKSVFGVIALLTFNGLWNDFFWSMLVLKQVELYTMPLLINKLLNTASSTGRVDMAMSLAMSMIAALPTILMYALCQKQMEKGLVFSGIKE